MNTLSFRLEQPIRDRLDTVTAKLGLNTSQVIRDALLARIEELEEMILLAACAKAHRTKKPANREPRKAPR